MATLRAAIDDAKMQELRRQKFKAQLDAMELARLAAALKPDLAGGTPDQQEQAISLAKRLFDRAIEAVVKPEAKGLLYEVAASVFASVKQEFADGCLQYDPAGSADDELKRYLRKRRMKVPQNYKKGVWAKLIKEHGWKVEGAGECRVPRKLIDDGVDRIKANDAARQARTRRLQISAEIASRK